MKATALGLAALVAWSCSAAPPTEEPNPLRKALLAQVAVARQQPLVLRYNPALCACPPFEAKIGNQWLRAQLVAVDPVAFEPWLLALGQTAVDALPVDVQVQATLDPKLWRTASGLYAVRVAVAAVVAPPMPAPVEPMAPVKPVVAPPPVDPKRW